MTKTLAHGIGRRSFLAVSAATGVAALKLPQPRSLAAETAPSNRIRVGAIGVGKRAALLLDQLPDGAEIVALSDCNLPKAEEYKAKRRGEWPVYQDYRRVLEHKDIDAVIVGTGEFQRVLPCIEACQAGKDVYAEKPLTLYIQEGRALVSAVRKHDRVLQVGSQQRSMAINRLACEFVRNGGLGKLLEVRAVSYKSAGVTPSPLPPGETVPAGFDWNQWLNQATERPFNEKWMNWGGLAGFRRRRNDQLGRSRCRPDSVGARSRRDRPCRDQATHRGSTRPSVDEVCQRSRGEFRPREGALRRWRFHRREGQTRDQPQQGHEQSTGDRGRDPQGR
jgi:hypothetical protein